jgi:hypothetical protein
MAESIAPAIWSLGVHAFTVTAFVGVMMIAVEYLNVGSRGALTAALRGNRWMPYVAAALLGATPGCLGGFAVVALYSHGALSFGALVACMVATSGDESFVMLALFPGKAAGIAGGLALLGVAAGVLVDRLVGARRVSAACERLLVHPDAEPQDRCLVRGEILRQLVRPSAHRAALLAALALFVAGVVSGELGPPEWNWIRLTLIGVGAFGLFVAATVPDHFLEEHFWRHVVAGHVPRIFLWTTAALAAARGIESVVPAAEAISRNAWAVLPLAALLGVVPESGPHLLFVTLHHAGLVPLSILVASSIAQDGHAMLPLLAHSRRDFLQVKAIKVGLALATGAVLLLLRW